MFYTGQKVVHIGFNQWSWWERIANLFDPPPPECPEIGEVYTIVNVIPCDDGEPCLELLELPSPAKGCWEAGFPAGGFRPAVETETDISIFERMLTPKREPVHG